MTEAEKITTLEKRAAHLESRLAGKSPHELSYDRQELAALRWALWRMGEIEEDRQRLYEIVKGLPRSSPSRRLDELEPHLPVERE